MPKCCNVTYDNGQCSTCGRQTKRGLQISQAMIGHAMIETIEWLDPAVEVPPGIETDMLVIDKDGDCFQASYDAEYERWESISGYLPDVAYWAHLPAGPAKN